MRVNFENVAPPLCETLVGLKPSNEAKATIGRTAFFGVGAQRRRVLPGAALNPASVKTFSGKMAMPAKVSSRRAATLRSILQNGFDQTEATGGVSLLSPRRRSGRAA